MVRKIKQPHEVEYLDGRPIDWRKPPAPNTKVRWSKRCYNSTKLVTGSFRHICHLNRLNNLALKKYGKEIEIIQPAYNTGVPASKGTHDFDMCVDLFIPGVSWWEQQTFFRANGLGCWYRHAPLFSNHIHGFTLPPFEGTVRSDDFEMAGYKVGLYVDGGYSLYSHQVSSSQLADYVNEAFGLADQHTPGSDKSWFPDNKAATVFDLQAYVARRRRLQEAA